jgi:hypothetical protein
MVGRCLTASLAVSFTAVKMFISMVVSFSLTVCEVFYDQMVLAEGLKNGLIVSDYIIGYLYILSRGMLIEFKKTSLFTKNSRGIEANYSLSIIAKSSS